MAFLCLFLIAFSELASEELSIDWMRSSLMGIFLDQIVFELLAAGAIGIVMITKKRIKCCKFLIFIPVLIEIYRIYRNLSE